MWTNPEKELTLSSYPLWIASVLCGESWFNSNNRNADQPDIHGRQKRGGRGVLAPLDFENFEEKRLFS